MLELVIHVDENPKKLMRALSRELNVDEVTMRWGIPGGPSLEIMWGIKYILLR